MKKKTALGVMLIFTLVFVGGCFFPVGGYGRGRAPHARGGYYHGYNDCDRGGGGYDRGRDNSRGGWYYRD